MEFKKISVIIPVYNVERYLKKCVDSVINQTYKNLEILLVDDGSTDNSGNLCDKFSKSDERITVIHKENGGLSDARNAGMDVSTGDYIGFVDSDDYIDKDFFETLITNIEKYDADVSCCRYTNVWEDGKREFVGNDNSLNIYEGIDALKEYLYGKTLDPFAWNKLFKAEMLGNLKYPQNRLRFIKGILGEDNPFCIELFKNTKTVVLAGLSKYNYLQARNGAITSNNVSDKKIASFYFWDDVRKDCETNYPELTKYALRRQALFYIGLYNRIYKDKSYTSDLNNIMSFIKAHKKELLSSDMCEKTVKISVFLLGVSPSIYNIFMNLYKRIVGKARL